LFSLSLSIYLFTAFCIKCQLLIVTILYELLTYFLSCKPDHQNFFGIDDRLGPVAVSFRREEKEGSSGAQYNYRIIFRTTEVNTKLSHTQNKSKNTFSFLPLMLLIIYTRKKWSEIRQFSTLCLYSF